MQQTRELCLQLAKLTALLKGNSGYSGIVCLTPETKDHRTVVKFAKKQFDDATVCENLTKRNFHNSFSYLLNPYKWPCGILVKKFFPGMSLSNTRSWKAQTPHTITTEENESLSVIPQKCQGLMSKL